MKTGATESLQKLPVHFNTTLRCVPNYVIYSSIEETIAGHRVHDALDEVDPNLVKNHPDFELYRTLQEYGRDGLLRFHGDKKLLGDHGIAWTLDKWKFFPILDKAYHRSPESRWFVFLEADTYISWPNLVAYLARLDPAKTHYMGSQNNVGDVLFAHGGSGFVISNLAMRTIVEDREADVATYDKLTENHWCGDCALGQAMAEHGFPLHYAFPHFQGRTPSTFDHESQPVKSSRTCSPIITYHHMTPEDIAMMWRVENDWWAETTDPLRHVDVFERHNLVEMLRLGNAADDWDNISEGREYDETELLTDTSTAIYDERIRASSIFEACQQLCEEEDDCVQYKVEYRTEGATCRLSSTIQLGSRRAATESASVRSGWLMTRIDGFLQSAAESCMTARWALP